MTRKEMLEKAKLITNGTDDRITQKGDIPQKGGEKVEPKKDDVVDGEVVEIDDDKPEEAADETIKAFEARAEAAEKRAEVAEKETREIKKSLEQLKEVVKGLTATRENEHELVMAEIVGKKTEPVGYATKYAVQMNGEYVTAKTEEALEPLANLLDQKIKKLVFAVFADGSVSKEPATTQEVIALMKIRDV